jgi:hypothetical protein
MRLERYGLSRDLLIDEFSELFHNISLDFIQKSFKIAFVGLIELLSIVGNFLSECFGLLDEIAF